MADLAYRTVYAMNRVEARMQLVRTYQETGSLSETARRWKTSRHTVRKWVCRYEAGGVSAVSMIAAMPPILLDEISTDLVFASNLGIGDDLPTRYKSETCVRPVPLLRSGPPNASDRAA